MFKERTRNHGLAVVLRHGGVRNHEQAYRSAHKYALNQHPHFNTHERASRSAALRYERSRLGLRVSS